MTTMATVYLQGGKTIEVPLEELEDYLYNNADKIEPRHLQRRGSRREQLIPEQTSTSNK